MGSTLANTSEMPEKGAQGRSAKTWYAVVAALLLASLATLPSYILLWPYWLDSLTYSHGLLVVAISLWLLLQQREYLDSVVPRPNYWAVIPFAGLLLVSTLAFAANIEIITTSALPVILLCAVLLVAGMQVARRLAFPILLLYSAIPVWDLINGALQSATIIAVTVLLRWLNIPAFIDGAYVQIPAGLFEIEGGCSGLHFLIVGLTIAAIYAYLYISSLRRKTLLVALMLAMSVLMNWFRVTAIIVAGHLTDMQSYLVKVDHYTFGWVLFLIMLVPFFLIARSMEDKEKATTKQFSKRPTSASLQKTVLKPLVTIGVVALLPVLVYARLLSHTPEVHEIRLPVIEGMSGPEQHDDSWQPRFRGAHGEALGTYSFSGGSVDVYANWFDGESQGRELIGYGADVAGPTLHRMYDDAYVESKTEISDNSRKFREIMAESRSGDRRLIHYTYIVGESSVADPAVAKIRQAVNSMLGRFGSGIIAWSMRCDQFDENCASARHEMLALGELIEAELLNTVPMSISMTTSPGHREEI